MRLEFKSLELDGFKSFVGGIHVLPLAEYGPGLHFVRGRNEAEPRLGPNGAGKSTLWDALCWCLYGKTPDGSRNPDIKPWHGKQKTTAVILRLNVDGKRRHIERTANPNLLTLDGSHVGQEQIDALVGLSFESFTHTVLLGQGQPLFFDLAPRDKLQLFSDVLNLERWEQRSAAAGTRARELEQQKIMLEGTVIGLEANRVSVWSICEVAKEKSEQWERERRDALTIASSELKEVTERLDKAQARYDELDPKYDWSCTQAKLLKAEIDKLLRDQPPVLALDLERKKLVKDLDTPHDVCPTCGQSINPKDIGRHRSEVRHQLKEIDAELRKAVKMQKQIDTLQASLTTYQSDAEGLKAEMDSLVPTLSDLKARKHELTKAVATYDGEDNPYRGQQQDLRKRLKKIDADIKEHETDIAKLGRRIERAKFWIRGFKDIRLYIIEEVLQELELATNALLEDVGLIGWSVQYDIEKETKSGSIQRGLNVTILSPVTKQRVRWESWSGGEGQRLRVIGALALSEVLLDHAGVQTPLEILDEPAHFMAPDGVRDLCDLLAARAQSLGKKIFMVDHMAIDSSLFASITTVVKDKQGSHIDGGSD